MNTSFYIAIPIMGILAVLQSTTWPNLPIAGVTPQILFLVALAWGLLRGMQEGLIWAFLAGLMTDLLSLAPLGVSSLAFMAAVAVAVLLKTILPPQELLVAILLAGLGTIIYLLIYVPALLLFNHAISINGLVELLPLVLLHILLIVPIYLIEKRILYGLRPRRVEL